MYDWIVGSTTYSLDDGASFFMDGISGTGMMPVRRLEERGPLQNGVTDRGYRLDPRVIIISMYIKGSSYENLYTKRTELINMFKPSNTAGKLKFTLGSTVRQIEGHYVGDSLGMDDTVETYLTKRVAVAIKCPDPRWYDPSMVAVTYSLGGGADTFVVPFEIPFYIGASTINTTKTVTYNGNIKSYPTIRITGPITDPVITHSQTGYKLDFTGITIAAGDYYEIDLGYSDNTIVDSAGDNVLDDLTTDSNLVEFAIEPSPTVSGGVNSINVAGTSVSEATQISINYYENYIGI